ncbi:hypothetical protein Scani_14500 [Streptomyces caniferus]|uniref:Uncharacterized protein n=1 Tax=Streptomyces caniferus TaxID=285557 RepID=A0A640S3F8_9ACTN|nr:hypothetical protein Scani_14500 [Streptomyces caniferus]
MPCTDRGASVPGSPRVHFGLPRAVPPPVTQVATRSSGPARTRAPTGAPMRPTCENDAPGGRPFGRNPW